MRPTQADWSRKGQHNQSGGVGAVDDANRERRWPRTFEAQGGDAGALVAAPGGQFLKRVRLQLLEGGQHGRRRHGHHVRTVERQFLSDRKKSISKQLENYEIMRNI